MIVATERLTSSFPNLRTYLRLTMMLSARALKIRYRGSFLGVFWSLSNPLLMTAVYSQIFGTFFAKYYNGSIAAYVLSVFVALAVLGFFTSSTAQALTSVVGNGSLLNKVSLPFSVFPASTIAANAFQLGVGTFPLLVVVAFLSTHSIVNVLAMAGPLTGLILTSLGFSLALSALYVYFRDLPYLYEVFSFIIYMTTPVFYPAELVPVAVRSYLAFNPIATIVESLRHIALAPGHPSMHDVFVPVITGLAALFIGSAIFLPLRRDFLDLL